MACGGGPAALLAVLTALEHGHDGPLPPAAWEMLRYGSRAAWADARRTEAAALQRARALALLASAGRWRRRHESERAMANLASARQALTSWRALAARAERAAGVAAAREAF